jgi:hypothetical protein
MRARILQGRPFPDAAERAEIQDYCMSDTDALEKLAPRLLPTVNIEIALHWGEAVAVLAAMEHRGVPIDTEIFPQLRDKRTWACVRDAIVPELNARMASIQDRGGDWHFSTENFVQYAAREGINWPRHADSRQARHAAQDLRRHGEGVAATRTAATTAAHARPNARGQAGRRA